MRGAWIIGALLSVAAGMPARAEESILDKLRRVVQPNAQPAAPVQRPKAEMVEVPGPLPDLNDQGCMTNRMLNSASKRAEQDRHKTSDWHTFLDTEPTKVVAGLVDARLDGWSLVIQPVSIGRYEEYSGPITNVIEKTIYEARPGTALFMHTLTLGIGLVLKPVDSVQHALGCTDRRISKREVLGAESAATGRSEWRDAPFNLQLRVEGLGPPREFNSLFNPAGGAVPTRIDLKRAAMEFGAESTQVRVTCMNCEEAGAASIPGAAAFRRQVVFDADFRERRATELARLDAERARIELARRGLVGRWSDRESCIRSERLESGMLISSLDGAQMAARVVTARDGSAEGEFESEQLELKAADQDEVELLMKLRDVRSKRLFDGKLRLKVSDGETRIATADGFGGMLPFSRLVNCDAPANKAARAAYVAEEQLKARQIRAAEDERQRRAAREEEERKRTQAERERELNEQRRKQEERERLYKL